jgi:hypothetical protein
MSHLKRSDDGISHLNVWSKARTELGQLASNFALTPFTHPEYGRFASVEALWYWLATGLQHNELRRLYGASAKTAGKRLPRVEMDSEKFQHTIKEAIRLKFEQTPGLKKLLIESTLPFEHYYVYGPDSDVIRDQRPRHGWQTDYLEHLRDTWRIDAGLTPLKHVRTKVVQEAEVDHTSDIGRGLTNPIFYGLDENGEIMEHKSYVKDNLAELSVTAPDGNLSMSEYSQEPLAKLVHDDIEINGF